MKRNIFSCLLCLAVLFSLCTMPTSAAVITQQDLELPKLEVVSLTPRCSQGPKETHEVPSGSATWSWVPDPSKPDQSVGIAIDAIAPWMWDGTPSVPSGLSQLKWDTSPDEVHISAYASKDKKNYEAIAEEEQQVDRPYIVTLKPGRIYVVTAHWNDSHLKTSGCGTVDYSFRT